MSKRIFGNKSTLTPSALASTSSLFREYFGPLAELPCWNVTAEYGSWLSLRFGQPHVEIREGNSESRMESLKRRRVSVEGEFLLWVEMGAWELIEGEKRLFHSEQSRSYLRRAAVRLDSQKLSLVELTCNPVCTVFTFDHGSRLRVGPTEEAESDEPLWHIYAQGNCLSLLANGTLEHGASENRKPRHTAARATVYAA